MAIRREIVATCDGCGAGYGLWGFTSIQETMMALREAGWRVIGTSQLSVLCPFCLRGDHDE